MKQKNLSVFIDESGDYGQFYIICLICHEQDNSIDKQIEYLNNKLKQRNYNDSLWPAD